MENLSSVVLLLKMSKNFLESEPFSTSRKHPYFEKNQLCACLIYLLSSQKQRHSIKIRTFRKKRFLFKNIYSSKFFEILEISLRPLQGLYYISEHSGYVHTVTFLHGFVLFHNPKGIPIYFQTIENDAKTLPCAHSLSLQSFTKIMRPPI